MRTPVRPCVCVREQLGPCADDADDVDGNDIDDVDDVDDVDVGIRARSTSLGEEVLANAALAGPRINIFVLYFRRVRPVCSRADVRVCMHASLRIKTNTD